MNVEIGLWPRNSFSGIICFEFLVLDLPPCDWQRIGFGWKENLIDNGPDYDLEDVFRNGQKCCLCNVCREGFFILPYNELAIAQGPKIYQKKAL